jgi:hypothetical protein
VSLGSFPRTECAKVPSPAGLRILLSRVKPVFAGLKFPDHWGASTHFAVMTTPSQTSFPSSRCEQGRVKLWALIPIQRLGITKLARFGATQPAVE